MTTPSFILERPKLIGRAVAAAGHPLALLLFPSDHEPQSIRVDCDHNEGLCHAAFGVDATERMTAQQQAEAVTWLRKGPVEILPPDCPCSQEPVAPDWLGPDRPKLIARLQDEASQHMAVLFGVSGALLISTDDWDDEELSRAALGDRALELRESEQAAIAHWLRAGQVEVLEAEA